MDTNYPDMRLLAERIASHLPDWTAVANNNDLVGILRRPDGAGIYLHPVRTRTANSRIEVSGDYPKGHTPYGERFEISISLKRAPEDMAADIQRRFLPEYDRLYAACWAGAEDERRRLQEKIETTQRLADLLGVACQTATDLRDMHKLSWSEGDFYAQVRTENGRVYLDRVSMSVAEFERIVPAIRNTSDANLIAAAPKLLDALETLVEFAHAALYGTVHQDNLEYFEDIARIAIDAATGRST
jgi:hypothetical protein